MNKKISFQVKLKMAFLCSLNLEGNQSGSVVASFTVPLGAAVGTVSVIVVTATSQWDGTQNYARATLVVISNVRLFAIFL
jgi:hypothetical protein